jgi:outer membrane protein assembly factor BamB
LVDGDMLIIEPGGRGASVVALEKASGKVLWQAGDDPASYSSPYPFDFKGQRCVAVFTAPGLVVRNIKDGKELSRFAWKTSWDVNAATLIFTEGRVFISSGYNKGCALLDISENPAKAVWQNKNMRNHCNSCVLWKGFLYGFDENELKCLDLATGETKWAEKRYGKGSLTLVDGKLLLYSDRGKLGLAEASSAGYKELGAFQALQVREYPGKASTDTWANAVLANGKIYCRSQNDLACFDAKGK